MFLTPRDLLVSLARSLPIKDPPLASPGRLCYPGLRHKLFTSSLIACRRLDLSRASIKRKVLQTRSLICAHRCTSLQIYNS